MSRGPRLILLGVVLGFLSVSSVAAQAPQDTLVVPVRGVELGFRAQMIERQALRRLPDPPADTTASPDAGIQRLLLDGLIVDETLTRMGGDFYEVFYRLWRPPAGAVNFTVTIQEQPSPSIGTRIAVHVNDEVAFQSQLLPREEMIEAAARQAVAFAHQLLQTRATSY